MPDNAFRENVIILTGASSGIGRALALERPARAHGWRWRRDAARLEAVAAECRDRGAQAAVVPTDVTDEAQCRVLVEKTVEAFGRIDTLVNNAGISMWAKFEEMRTLAPFDEVMRVNYLGSVYCTYHASAPEENPRPDRGDLQPGGQGRRAHPQRLPGQQARDGRLLRHAAHRAGGHRRHRNHRLPRFRHV